MVATNLANPRLTGLYIRNFAANLAGNLIIALLNIFTPTEFFETWQNFVRQSGWILLLTLLPTVFIIAGIGQCLIQRPLAVFLKQIHLGQQQYDSHRKKAERRLLNLPLLLGLLNFTLWVTVSCIFMPILYLVSNFGIITGFYIIFRGVIIGLLASFISFFLVDNYSRKKLIYLLFPEGQLANVPGTVKISILRRIRVLLAAGTGAPMLILLGTLALVLWEMDTTTISAKAFGQEIFNFIIVLYGIFVAIALILNFLVGKSIIEPVKAMMKMVAKVRRGDFSHKVQVDSNDELGVLGDGMNEMTEGLIERDRMQQSLYLAKEIQQTLLPRTDPQLKGLDIASKSVYCDETGGDYYDYLGNDEAGAGKLSVVVGDVSGHGISSALLMATASALLRQRSALPGTITQIVSDVNRQLTRDIEESSGFITLFYLTLDVDSRKLSWVRAGHDPALIYDPAADIFEELRGAGMALGVKADEQFEESERSLLTANNIIFLGTDGIWEARNSKDEMFGKEPIYRTIRRNSAASAREILTAIFNSFNNFLENRAPEDDVTMIVIKIQNV
jgi:sigma-B regulation protein RsbU (phosphoserine phosphatase)